MYQRTEYEMTESDLEMLLDACKPVPVMMIGGMAPSSTLENANCAWTRLGARMGFDPRTVRPVPGKGQRFFSAVPSETKEAKAEREKREAEEKRQRDIVRLREEIAELQKKLAALTKEPSQ